MGIRYGSVCSGIEAASQAWEPLGWTPQFFSEIDKFPCAVLAHHYGSNLPGKPVGNGVPNHGDMTKFKDWPDHAIDLLVGGTPCQSFSIAGLRAGLADPRGNLMLTYLAIAAKYRPRWLAWENVPGVLSSNGGRDFGTFLRGLVELGYGFAYRVLDAQYIRVGRFAGAVPQRRRRVFVVGYLGDWRRAAAVLFDAASLRGDSAPRREAGQGTSHAVAPSLVSSGRGIERTGDTRGQDIAFMSNASGAHFTSAQGLSPTLKIGGDGGNAMAIAIQGTVINRSDDAGPKGPGFLNDGSTFTLTKEDQHAVAWSIMPQNSGKDFKARAVDVAQPIMAGGPVGGNQGGDYIQQAWAVRRLTPKECARLQGFPDDYFDGVVYRGKKPADGPIYKALGNSMAVNAMAWIGERIALVDALQSMRPAA